MNDESVVMLLLRDGPFQAVAPDVKEEVQKYLSDEVELDETVASRSEHLAGDEDLARQFAVRVGVAGAFASDFALTRIRDRGEDRGREGDREPFCLTLADVSRAVRIVERASGTGLCEP